MKRIPHHPGTSCYEHSVFVAYIAFRLAPAVESDYVAAARGGLLHDLYLYNPKDRTAHPGNQCFDHPKVRPSETPRPSAGGSPQGAEYHHLPHVAPGPADAPLQGGFCGQSVRQALRHRRGGGLLAPLPGAGDGYGLNQF